MEEGANKILSQFEQFNEYIKSQVVTIRGSISQRAEQCSGGIKKLEEDLIPSYKSLLQESNGTTSGAGKKDFAKLEAFKEHGEALEKHISST